MASTDLFQVKNGFVDLKTGQFYENHQENENLIEWKGIDYPTNFIDNYISQLVNTDDIHRFQKILGYFISSCKINQIVLLIYGNCNNGKSTFINFLKQILNKQYLILPSTYLTTLSQPNINITGNTKLIINEPEDINKLKLRKIKEIINSDLIYNNTNMYTTQNETTPKMILVSNKPFIDYNDNGFNRRSRTIKFTNNFTPDATFPDTLMDKLDEFLVWLVKGSIMYYNDQTL